MAGARTKYTKRRVENITQLIESDDYTVKEICQRVGISVSTYFQWQIDWPEFSEAVKNAEERRLDTFKSAARSGLMALLKGKEWEETTTELTEGADGKPKIKMQRKVKKFALPNPTSVIFALKNLDPDRFRDVVQTRQVDENGKDVPVVIFRLPDNGRGTEIKENDY